jgi:hypothetical protein
MPVHDYSSDIESATSWLGRRHLLAVPINSRRDRQMEPVRYLWSTQWHARIRKDGQG